MLLHEQGTDSLGLLATSLKIAILSILVGLVFYLHYIPKLGETILFSSSTVIIFAITLPDYFRNFIE